MEKNRTKKNRGVAWIVNICMLITMLCCMPPLKTQAADVPSVYYSGHMQSYGNLAQVKDGTTLGNLGTGKRLEAVTIQSTVALTYRAHVQKEGWQPWKTNGQLAGTTGKGRRLEALCIRLTGDAAEKYDILPQPHRRWRLAWMVEKWCSFRNLRIWSKTGWNPDCIGCKRSGGTGQYGFFKYRGG